MIANIKDFLIPGITSICHSQDVCFGDVRDSIDWSLLKELSSNDKYQEIGPYIVNLCLAMEPDK